LIIVHKYIEIHLKGCVWWIIVMEFRVLLITHYLIREILIEVVLDVHVRNVKIKIFSIQMLQYIFYKKSSWRDTCVGLHIENHMFLTRPIWLHGCNVNEMRYDSQCSIVDEEPNPDATKLFDLLEDSNEPL